MLYAIGDCHARYDLLQKLYQEILNDIKKVNDPLGAQIIFLGDYIDRGPNSKEVLEFLINLQNKEGLEHIFLLANHEQFMIDAFDKDFNRRIETYKNWCFGSNGGKETLKSFGMNYDPLLYKEPPEDFKKCIEWMKTLPFYYEFGDYIFCHSGYVTFDPDYPLSEQKDSMLWGRASHNRYVGCNKWIIHGHDALESGKPLKTVNKINVDVGCGWAGVNTLAAVALPVYGNVNKESRFIQVYL